jgi:hypothetical protein
VSQPKLDYSDETAIIIEIIVAVEAVIIIVDEEHTAPRVAISLS